MFTIKMNSNLVLNLLARTGPARSTEWCLLCAPLISSSLKEVPNLQSLLKFLETFLKVLLKDFSEEMRLTSAFSTFTQEDWKSSSVY